jgi:hypothetical protein
MWRCRTRHRALEGLGLSPGTLTLKFHLLLYSVRSFRPEVHTVESRSVCLNTTGFSMSDDIAPGAFSHSHSQSQLSPEDIISLAREAIEASRDEVRRSGEGVASTELQQPGVTVDLGHKNIVRLPEEVIDIIKDEIERFVTPARPSSSDCILMCKNRLAISHNRVSAFPARLAECKRLRYLNVRYNHLKEVPRPVRAHPQYAFSRIFK